MLFFKTYRKRIISAIVLIGMLLGAGHIIGYLLKPVLYETDIYAAEFDEMKKHNDKVDLVILGTSRVIRSCNPKIFEEKLSLNNVFNLSMNQMDMNGYYFQLKEFIEEFHPKTVVMSITHGMFIKTDTPIIVKLKLAERLHGRNCLEYIMENISISEYPYFIPLYRYKKYIYRIEKNAKERLDFQGNKLLKDKNRQYMGKGFVAYSKRVPLGNVEIKEIKKFDKTMVSESTIDYLEKCVQLCKDNNVQLFFMTPPTSMAYVYNVGNYQDLIDYISDYAKKNNIVYHNLNYLKGREEWFPDSMMNDTDHINKKGSAVFSEKYAEILSKSMNHIDTSEYFYSSLAEMQKSVNRIVAVDSSPVIENDMMFLAVKSLQNEDVIPQYQVLLARKKNDFKPIVDWTNSDKLSFKIPKGRTYRVLLRARHKKTDSYYAWKAWEVDKNGVIQIVQDVKFSNKKY